MPDPEETDLPGPVRRRDVEDLDAVVRRNVEHSAVRLDEVRLVHAVELIVGTGCRLLRGDSGRIVHHDVGGIRELHAAPRQRVSVAIDLQMFIESGERSLTESSSDELARSVFERPS